MKTKTRILSIDGGGIKGIVPAVVLNHLEKYLKQLSNNPNARIIDYFDLFSGLVGTESSVKAFSFESFSSNKSSV